MAFKQVKMISCEPYDDYTLWVQFDDGVEGKINLKNLVGQGVFNSWNDIVFFKTAHISEVTHTVTWGEDLDLDPYVIYDQLAS